MSLKKVSLYSIIIAAFFTGYYIETSLANRGIIVLSQSFVALIAAVYLLTNFKYNKQWLVLSSVLILLLLFNGSSYGSIVLVSINLILVEMFRKISVNYSLTDFFGFKYIYIFVYFIFSIALINLFYGSGSLWTLDGGKFLSLDRLQLFTSEPSHLALLLVPLIYLIKSIRNKVSLFFLLFFTQSYLGYVFFGIFYFIQKKISFLLIILMSIPFLYYLTMMSFDDFFYSSGSVRLIGITLFTDKEINLFHLIFGNGLGAGDSILQTDFSYRGVDQANGFLFSTIYDLGFLGIFLFVYILGKTYFEYFIIFFLLLNFGAGNILVVIILFLSKIAYKNYLFTEKFGQKSKKLYS